MLTSNIGAALTGLTACAVGTAALGMGRAPLSLGRRAARAAVLIGFGLIEAGLLLGIVGDQTGVHLERLGCAVVSAASPFIILSLAPAPAGRKRWLAAGGFVLTSLAATAFALAETGAGTLALRISLWAGFALSLFLAPVIRSACPEIKDDRLWSSLTWVLLPGAPIFLAAQLPLMSEALAPARPWLSGLDVAWFSIGLSWAFSRDALIRRPGRAEPDHAGAGTASPLLDERDQELAQLLREGLAYKEIAARLGLAPKTIDHRIQAMYRRAGVGSRQALLNKLDSQSG